MSLCNVKNLSTSLIITIPSARYKNLGATCLLNLKKPLNTVKSCNISWFSLRTSF